MSSAPEGWYPNVHDSAQEIYWDGETWTGGARPKVVPEEATIRTAPPGWYRDGAGSARWWTGIAWSEPYSAQPALSIPGRIPGFVLGLIAALSTPIPLVCLPLGIVGWVQSAKALKVMPSGQQGRGLALAGFILSIAAVSLTTLFMLLAIPVAVERNF